MFRFRQPGRQKLPQKRLQWCIRGDELIVGGGVVAFGAHGGEEVAQGGFVFVSDEVGFGDQGGAVLEIDEAVGAFELEADFLGIHQVEDRDVVLAVTQVLERVTERAGIREQIRQDHHEGTLANLLGDGVERTNQPGLAGRFEFAEGGEEPVEVGGTAAGRDFEVEFVGADGQPGGVALVCLLYTSPSPRDRTRSRMPSSA